MTPHGTADPRQRPFSSLETADLICIAVIVLAFVLRLYYFFLTKDQPLWWDEAQYMLKAKALAFGTPETGWYKSRAVLLSFVAAGVFKLGMGEIAIRLLWVALSTATLCLVYRLGALLYNKRVALYAVALAAAFYIDLFYASRLLLDVPQVFFVTLAAFLLVRSLYDESATYCAWAVGPVLMLGMATRFTVGIFLLVAAVLLIAVKRRRLLRDNRWLVSLGLGAAVYLPFLVYFWKSYGNPFLPFISQGIIRMIETHDPSSPGEVLLQYIRYFPNYTNAAVTLVFLAGIALAVAAIAGRRGSLAADRGAQGHLLLLLWTVVPFLFHGLLVDHFEDRYLAMIFPAVFILTGAALDTAYEYGKKFNAAAAMAGIALFLLYAFVSMELQSHTIIVTRVAAFAAVRDAGLWIKEQSRPGDAVVTSSVPQNTYYAERASYGFPKQPGAFDRLLAERRPKFLVLSIWEHSPQWAYDWPERHPETAEIAVTFFLDQAHKRPAAVVYALRNDDQN